jgi:hypothetical protein
MLGSGVVKSCRRSSPSVLRRGSKRPKGPTESDQEILGEVRDPLLRRRAGASAPGTPGWSRGHGGEIAQVDREGLVPMSPEVIVKRILRVSGTPYGDRSGFAGAMMDPKVRHRRTLEYAK